MVGVTGRSQLKLKTFCPFSYKRGLKVKDLNEMLPRLAPTFGEGGRLRSLPMPVSASERVGQKLAVFALCNMWSRTASMMKSDDELCCLVLS